MFAEEAGSEGPGSLLNPEPGTLATVLDCHVLGNPLDV